MIPEEVTITRDQYEDLVRDQNFLCHLYDYGVDNWEGYNLAQESFDEVYLNALD